MLICGKYFSWSKFLIRLIIATALLPASILYCFVISFKECRIRDKSFKDSLFASIKVVAGTVGFYLLAGLKH